MTEPLRKSMLRDIMGTTGSGIVGNRMRKNTKDRKMMLRNKTDLIPETG